MWRCGNSDALAQGVSVISETLDGKRDVYSHLPHQSQRRNPNAAQCTRYTGLPEGGGGVVSIMRLMGQLHSSVIFPVNEEWNMLLDAQANRRAGGDDGKVGKRDSSWKLVSDGGLECSFTKVAFGSSQERKIFPTDSAPNRMGNEMVTFHSSPMPGPGCYDNHV
ncbi:protein pitchfork, partial [Clarias magur]